MTKVTGELISIDDSAYDGFNGMTVYGNTVQNLWVNPSGTNNGVTCTPNADGSITVSGTATAGSYTVARSYALRPGTQYTLSVDKSTNAQGFYVDAYNADNQSIQVAYVGGSQGMSLSETFTLRSNAAYVNLGFGVNPGSTVSGTYRVMLNEGSTAEPWCPPGLNGVDELSVVTAGKNLFGISQEFGDLSGWDNTQLHNEGDGWVRAETSARAMGIRYKKNKIRFMPATYTLSFEAYANKTVYVGYNYIMDSEQGNVGLQSMGAAFPIATTEKQRISCSFTLDVEFNGSFMIGIGDADAQGTVLHVRNVQLELGSTATDYEPPNITTTPIDLQGHSLNSLPDGTRDELHIDGGGNVVLEKRTGTYIANGDEGWELSATSDAPYRMKVDNWSKDVENVLFPVNRFQVDRLPKYGATPVVSSFVVVNGKWELYAARNGIQDASAFSEWLKSNPMTLIYPLAAPQTIDLGKIDLPKLRKKPLVNNVWANGSAETTSFYLDTEMELTYRQWPGVRADGFKVSGKHNFWDFASCLASSDSGKPEKKFVTATVPYMSGFYDLSKIYGAIAYESRDVSYTFEILGDDMDDLQRQKTNLLDWLGLVHDEPIYDDTQPNYHYVGSFYEADWEEDETGESGTLTVTFKCQPFLIADRATEESLSVGTHTVVNHGQQVSVFAKANSGSATVKINGVIQAVTTTEQRLTAQLQPGENEVVVTSNSVTLRYYERHL